MREAYEVADDQARQAATSSAPSLFSRTRLALSPEPAPLLLRAGLAVLIDIIVVFLVVRAVLVASGHGEEELTHAILPALFGSMFALLGSLGGSPRSGLIRAALLALAAFPFTLLAIAVRDLPVGSALALGAVAFGAGVLAWYGEPLATLGSVLLYMFFIPLVFGAGVGVPMRYLVISFATMVVTVVILRALILLVPKHKAPVRVKATDESTHPKHFTLVAQPQLSRLHRTTARSAIGLGLGAFVMAWTGDHNAVWVLMTLIALIPPALPLTISRVLQRLAGTVLAMVVLTTIDALVPAGPLRLLALAPGIVITIAYMRRSYTLSVLGISTVAVLAYAQVHMPLGEALLYRGLDTIIGAVIAIVLTLLIPVGRRPHPVWQ